MTNAELFPYHRTMHQVGRCPSCGQEGEQAGHVTIESTVKSTAAVYRELWACRACRGQWWEHFEHTAWYLEARES